jgi:hypothetical protein
VTWTIASTVYEKIWCRSLRKHNLKIEEQKLYSVFSKEHQMDIYKLVSGSVSTLLDNLLQPVRHTLHHVVQNLAVSHLEDPQPGDLLLQCLQVGGAGVLLKLHIYPAPSSILQLYSWKMASHLVSSCWLTGYCVIGMLPFIHVPN